MSIIPDYDALWKDIIQAQFEPFIAFFLPDLHRQVDFSKQYEYLEQELRKISPNALTKKRYTDQLVKVFLKDGMEKWILIHIEVQGSRDETFSLRMYQYYYRIFDRFNENVCAIAIFTDNHPSFKPHIFSQSTFGTQLKFQYNIYKVLEQDETELRSNDNPFALAVLAGLYVIKNKLKASQSAYEYKRALLRILFENNYTKQQRNDLFVFLDAIIQVGETETIQLVEEFTPHVKEGAKMSLSMENTSFAKHFIKQGREQGREEGREEGQTEKARQVAKKLILLDMSLEKIAETVDLSIQEIEAIKKELT